MTGSFDPEWEATREQHEQDVKKAKQFRAAWLASEQAKALSESKEGKQQPKAKPKRRRYY